MTLGGQNALLESFSAIAEALTGSGDLAAVLRCIAEESLRLLHATSARVRMPDATGTHLLLAAFADDEQADIRLPPPDPASHIDTDSIAGKAFRTNRIYVGRGAPRRGIPKEQYALHCSVPLTTRNRTLGVLTLWRTTDQPFTEGEVAIVRIFGKAAALAIEQVRLLTEERDRTRRMETLTEVARIISAATERDALYEAVYVQCARLFAVESLRITRVNPVTSKHIPEFWYIDGIRRPDREGIPLQYGLSFVVAETRQSFSTDDYYAERVSRGIPVSKPMNSGTAFEAKAWLGVPLLAGDTLLGVIAMYGKSGAYTPDEREAFAAIANQVSVALQNVELIERERSRAERLAILNDISQTISAVLDLEPLLRAIARECMRLLNLRFPLIGYRTATGGWMTATGAAAAIAYHDGETGIGPLATIAMEMRAPLFVPDYEAACHRRDLAPASLPGLELPLGWIGVPMVIGAHVVGVLAGFAPAEEATAENAQLLSIMANQAAIAIENARLYHEAQELGVVEERNRLAREIHDTIAQGLTATTYQLELADTFLAMEPPNLDRAKEKLHRSLELTRANLDEARRSVMDLRAAHVQNVTLAEAFERLAATFANDSGVTVTVTATDDFPLLPSAISAGLYRIGQEALANIAKHARATLVEFSLGVAENTAVLTILDNGVGFDPQIVATQRTARGTSGGFGLIGIRERAQLLGGTSDIWSDVGAGTRIVVRVPIPL